MSILVGETSRMKEAACPVCRSVMDAAALLTGEKGRPTPGDYTICLYCATILRFKADESLTTATRNDLSELRREQPKEYDILLAAVWAAKQRIAEARRRSYPKN